jgi:hypothetical protein
LPREAEAEAGFQHLAFSLQPLVYVPRSGLGFAFCIHPSSFPLAFHPQPVEQRALGLLLAGCDFGEVPNGMCSSHRPALSHL